MVASYQLRLTIEGSSDVLRTLIKIVSRYSGEKPQYFLGFNVNGTDVDFKIITENIISELTLSGVVRITAYGPYGGYSSLEEVEIFKELSEAAGTASFSGEITGSGSRFVLCRQSRFFTGCFSVCNPQPSQEDYRCYPQTASYQGR